jgi:hypothetical protein
VAHRFLMVKPRALELVDSGFLQAGSATRTDSHHAAENGEVIIAEGVDWHDERRPLKEAAQGELTQPPPL